MDCIRRSTAACESALTAALASLLIVASEVAAFKAMTLPLAPLMSAPVARKGFGNLVDPKHSMIRAAIVFGEAPLELPTAPRLPMIVSLAYILY